MLEGCCDPCNDKVLRASKGAVLKLPYQVGNWELLDSIVDGNALFPLVADIEGEGVKAFKGKKRVLLVLGSESFGPSVETVKRCNKVCLPMSHSVESLNVAVAGSVLMYLVKM